MNRGKASFSTMAMVSAMVLALPAQAEEPSLLDRLILQDAAVTSAARPKLGATRSLLPTAPASRGLRPVPSVVTAQPADADDGADTGADGFTHATGPYMQLDPDLLVEIRVQFGFDSAALDDAQKPDLAEMCTALSQTDFAVRIIGHTDSSGSEAYNLNLSLLRAQEVARYLSGECGIAGERLEVMGVGEQVPADPADPTSEINRRVEFQVVG